MSPIGLAVIGAGYSGPNLIRTALATPAIQLEWLCDLDEARAQKVLGHNTKVKTSASYDAVLGDPAVAAVAIATPAVTHRCDTPSRRSVALLSGSAGRRR